jgi:hypothetical protein
MNNLYNHIDAPIRKCVAGLNLLGIKTGMSCCGFSYKGEEVPKTHLQKTYIYIDRLSLSNLACAQLINLAGRSGWTLSFPNGHWIDFYGNTWDKSHPWAEEGCPHFYETHVLAINSLEKAIETEKGYFLNEVVIEDGNKMYKDKWGIKYWQYEPTEPWIVTPEVYKNL